jgi:predicted alpha/beta hydrolase family esterase
MPTPHTLPSPLRAPSLALLAAEPFRAMFDAFSSQVSVRPQEVGDGHPVIVYPGLGAGSMNTSQLRLFLNRSGFEASDWGGGVNIGHEGEFDHWLGGLVAQMEAIRAQHGGRRVSLVGWSLGGIFAREIAKRAPGAVRSVITLATPFAALGDANHAGTIYKLLNGNAGMISPRVASRLKLAPPVPTTSVYSKSDGIVSWQGCIEKPSNHAESVEVETSHLGMVNHPHVQRIVAERLAQPEGRWKPLVSRRTRRPPH